MSDQHPDSDSDLLSIGEAAALLQVSIDTLRRWDAKGYIMSTRTPSKHRRFRRADVEALMAA
jgi:excisionase family DNA binding protein